MDRVRTGLEPNSSARGERELSFFASMPMLSVRDSLVFHAENPGLAAAHSVREAKLKAARLESARRRRRSVR